MSGVLDRLIDRTLGAEASLTPQIAPSFMPPAPETTDDLAADWPQSPARPDPEVAGPAVAEPAPPHPPGAEPHARRQLSRGSLSPTSVSEDVHHFEAELLVEGERALDVGDVDIDVNDFADHRAPLWTNRG